MRVVIILTLFSSHYFIVVINATLGDILSITLVDNNELGPHRPFSSYYVAAVISQDNYNPDEPFILGDGTNTTFDNTRYQNVPITLGIYRYFVRAYTIGPVSKNYNITVS